MAAASAASDSTTVIVLRIMPIQQLKAMVPGASGVKATRLSPVCSRRAAFRRGQGDGNAGERKPLSEHAQSHHEDKQR